MQWKRTLVILLLIGCFSGLLGCSSSKSAYEYNRADGLSDGCPLPEDAPSPYQNADLTVPQFAALTGIDLTTCLPQPRSTFRSTFQYGYFSEADSSQPTSIHSAHRNDSDTEINLSVFWDDLGPQSVMALFETRGRSVSTVNGCEILFYHEPADGPVNYEAFDIYAAAFSIDGTNYYVRVQNNASAKMLEQICETMIKNLSNP